MKPRRRHQRTFSHKKSSEMGNLLEKWEIFKQNTGGLQQQDSAQPSGQNLISRWGGEKHV